MFHQGDALILADLAGGDAADGDAADVVAPIERNRQHLQGGVQFHIGRRHGFQDRIEKRGEIDRFDAQVGRRDPLTSGRKDRGKLQRGVVGIQFHEQIEDGVQHIDRTGVGAVDLVDDDDGP